MAGVTEGFFGLAHFFPMTLETIPVWIATAVNDFPMFFNPFGAVPVLGTINRTKDNK